ncbi:ABC transporter substrate-binding protein [Burkholderia sp. PU8-34]
MKLKRAVAAAGLSAAAVWSIGAHATSERNLRIDEAAVEDIDPAKASDYGSVVITTNVYDALVEPEGKTKIEPALASSWTVSPDGKKYTFTLRSNVAFHDGGKVNADDVVYSFNRMRTINQGNANLFDGVESVTAAGKSTVVFTLKRPDSSFLANLVFLRVLSQDVCNAQKKPGNFGANGDYCQAYLRTHDAGSGAYKVQSQDSKSMAVLVRDSSYFGSFEKNAPETVRIRYSLDPTTVRAMLMRKEHDISSEWLPNETLAALSASGVKLMRESGTGLFLLSLNMQRAPTDDLAVRKAIALGFDYGTMMSLLKINSQVSKGQPINGPIPAGMPGYDPSIPAPKRDVAAAKQWLAKSKYKGQQLTLDLAWAAEVPFEEKVALLFQQNMAEIGIKVNIAKLPWSVLSEHASKPETTPQVAEVYTSLVTPDVDSALSPLYGSEGAGTWLSMSWMKNADVDHLLAQARSTANATQRAQLYRDLGARIVALQPSVFVNSDDAVFAKQANISNPMLDDPGKTVPMAGGNFLFRKMSIN